MLPAFRTSSRRSYNMFITQSIASYFTSSNAKQVDSSAGIAKNIVDRESGTDSQQNKDEMSADLNRKFAHFVTSTKQRMFGEDFWIPVDELEPVVFPSDALGKHQRVKGSSTDPICLYECDASQLRSKWLHVTFERHQTVISVYRSDKMTDAKLVYDSLRRCVDLLQFVDTSSEERMLKDLQCVVFEVTQHPDWLPIHVAAKLAMKHYMQKLQFELGEDAFKNQLQTPCEPDQKYPLHLAIESKSKPTVAFLLENGATLDQKDGKGSNGLHYAARHSAEILELLFTYPFTKPLLNTLNTQRETPLYLAIRDGGPLCVHVLMNNGAQIKTTFTGQSPLHEIMRTDAENLDKVIAELLKSSPDLLAHDRGPKTGNTSLHVAVNKKPLGALLSVASSQLDLNAQNNLGDTAMHTHTAKGDLGCILTLAAYGADVNCVDKQGWSPLGVAVKTGKLETVQALLVLGADKNQINPVTNETVRHFAAKQTGDNRSQIVRALAIAGAKRCSPEQHDCTTECAASGSDDYGMNSALKEQNEILYHINKRNKQCMENVMNSNVQNGDHLISMLSLDGGGIRGLVLIQVLFALEEHLGEPLTEYIDWIAGTSTGSILGAGLSKGKTLRECQRIYLRFKDGVFAGNRPYNTPKLEEFIRSEMGADTTLADIPYPRLTITTLAADYIPADFVLIRNYQLPLDAKTNEKLGYNNPKDELVWRALRKSSAAPTYFTSVDGKYMDGGLAANNPTLDLLCEVERYNSVLAANNNSTTDQVRVGCVISVGCGKCPPTKVESLDFDISGNLINNALALKNLGLVMIEQLCETEGVALERARSMAHAQNTPLYRYNPKMSKLVELDTKDDKDVVLMMWETMEWVYSHMDHILECVELLRAIGKARNRQQLFKGPVE